MSETRRRGPDRRDILKCMGWAGTGALWSVSGGVLSSVLVDQAIAAPRRAHSFSFVQVSDSHIGFDKAANPDARATFREAVAKIRALPEEPDFILHTGDISHLSKDQEFDDADQIIGEAGVPVFHIPGEHDMLDEGGGGRARDGELEQGISPWRVETAQEASGWSTRAIGVLARTKVAVRRPSTLPSWPAGTTMGPGAGAVPGAGWGKAVERAVWKLMFPSTFWAIWWMWPFSTVTEPNRRSRPSACSESSVPQPQSG